ncbi:MAG TPA: YbjQ family protein [Thermoplasmata archaeon]|nr:YbjQ family protein [Thermoplasmata archaeon]HIH98288.1 YbjQ family protein [Thermoplasmata archaeon]
MDETRELAIRKMVERASDLGANAIIGVRFSTIFLLSGFAEIFVCGTAVVLKEIKGAGCEAI